MAAATSMARYVAATTVILVASGAAFAVETGAADGGAEQTKNAQEKDSAAKVQKKDTQKDAQKEVTQQDLQPAPRHPQICHLRPEACMQQDGDKGGDQGKGRKPEERNPGEPEQGPGIAKD
jgi:hypothetical protein